MDELDVHKASYLGWPIHYHIVFPAKYGPLSEFAKRAWARLIRKVHEVDPLECRKCKGPMHVIAAIDDPHVVRQILTHLGRWRPRR
jgi:hypothetical protein